LLGSKAVAALPAVIKAWEDRDPVIRHLAVQATARLGKAAVAVVLERLKEDNGERRLQALDALGNMGGTSRECLACVVKTLHKDEKPENRSAAADCLGRLAGAAREKVPELIEALKDKSPQVRQKAAEALGRMGPLAKEAQDALRERQKNDEDAEVRSLARDALKLLQGKKKD